MTFRSRRRRYAVVSIHDRSWGRTTLGLSVADNLRNRGADVSFVVHKASAPLLNGRGFESRVVSNTLGPLLGFAVQEFLADLDPDAIVLCDYFSTCNMMHRVGVDALDFLFEWPVVALDLWDHAATGFEVDGLPGRTTPLCLRESSACRRNFLERVHQVVPVPIASLTGSTPRFRLPKPDSLARKPPPEDSGTATGTILTTTADWQHRHLADEYWQRTAKAVPLLIAHQLEALGPQIRWIHVGPRAFELDGALQGRYDWRGQVSANELDELVASSDLVLSLNASATTTTRAVHARRPVVLVQNSLVIGPDEDPRDVVPGASPHLASWFERARPIDRFRMWPLGYHAFLDPLMEGNAYFDVVTPLELFHEEEFVRTCERLLFDPGPRASSAQAQEEYLDALAALAEPAEVLDTLLLEGMPRQVMTGG